MKCKYCRKEIEYIKVSGKYIPVNTQALFVVPTLHGTNNYYVSEHGSFIKGEEANDGLKCYTTHRCNIEKVEETEEDIEVDVEVIFKKTSKKYEQLSLF